MADSFIQLSPDSTGKKVDTENLTVGADSVHRERMQIAGDSATDIAPVTAADGLTVNLGANNDVTVASLPLPSGAATLAEQQTQSTALTAIETSVQLIDNAVAGSELQVDVVAALPAGNNNIGDVDIASLPNEGQQTMANSISVAIASDQTAVPVSGTVAVTGSATLAEQQTQTTHLAAIRTSVETLDNAIAGSEMQVDVVGPLPAGTNNIGDVDVLSSALPTGAATSANQATEIASLATIAGDTTDIEAAVELIDDTVAVLGTDTYTEATTKGLIVGAVRRDADTTLVNTTNEIAPLQVDANGRLKVEAFSGETLPVSLAAGGTTQYAEDTAHVSGDLVTMAGVVQQTADAALSSDGDRSALQVDNSGWLKVNIKAGAGSGGTAMVDDAAFTPATTSGTPAFALADETSPDSVDEGDAGALRMTLDRKLLTRIVGATDANRLDVDGSGHAQVDIAAASVTVPVSAASLPLPTGASTLAEQQTQTTHLATIAGDTTDIEAAVELIDDTVKTLGTDTYTEATTKGLLIGGVRRDADTTLVDTTNEIAPFQVDARGFVKVEAFSGETLPVSGTVTANAGTNLNTSALALESGGNLATAVASLSVLDDWDESDRAKVNPIAGQAGVQGASGAVTALTQRVVLATDVALPAGTNNIGDVDVLTMPVTEVVGDVAADAAVPANPLSIGGRASTAVPTAVSADGDSVYNWLNRLGMQVVSAIPGLGLNADPLTLLSETAQYTSTQTSAVLVAGGGSERIVVTSIQIQVGGTTAGTLQVYFGTGAYSRGTDEAIFDGEFAPSATLKPGFFAAPPAGFRAGALGDDILVTTSAAINPLTITVWYYILGV